MASASGNTPNINQVGVGQVTVGALQAGVVRTSITCTNANTDYAAGAVIPAGSVILGIYCQYDCIVGVDEATDATHGQSVAGGLPQEVAVIFGAGDSKVHAQSPVAGAVVNIWYKAS